MLHACPRNGNGNSSILKSFWENIQKLNINEAFPFPFRCHAMAKCARTRQFACSVATPQSNCFFARSAWQILCERDQRREKHVASLEFQGKMGIPGFSFFIKCLWTKPRKQDFGQDAIQRTRRTCRQPISDNRLQMLISIERILTP